MVPLPNSDIQRIKRYGYRKFNDIVTRRDSIASSTAEVHGRTEGGPRAQESSMGPYATADVSRPSGIACNGRTGRSFSAYRFFDVGTLNRRLTPFLGREMASLHGDVSTASENFAAPVDMIWLNSAVPSVAGDIAAKIRRSYMKGLHEALDEFVRNFFAVGFHASGVAPSGREVLGLPGGPSTVYRPLSEALARLSVEVNKERMQTREITSSSELDVDELAIHHILTRPRDTPVRSVDQLYCDLPPCSLVRKSRLESRRCDALGTSSPDAWPLLITSTPRSGTVFMQTSLNEHGMQIQDDWIRKTMRDGRVSWIHAFDDKVPIGRARDDYKRFSRVLHQVREPLTSITSLCTEPFNRDAMKSFIQRHIKLESSREQKPVMSRVCLEMVEEVDLRSIFEVAGLGHLYSDDVSNATRNSNHRGHRETFTWQDLYTIDPTYALKAWELAHYYGYNYTGQANFNDLICLKELPMCVEKKTDLGQESDLCRRHSENQYPKSNRTISAPSQSLGFDGWVDAGCVEVESSNGTYIGVRGLISQQDLSSVKNELEPSILRQLNETLLHREGNTSLDEILTRRAPSRDSQSVVTNSSREREPLLQASFNASTSSVNLTKVADDMMLPTITGIVVDLEAPLEEVAERLPILSPPPPQRGNPPAPRPGAQDVFFRATLGHGQREGRPGVHEARAADPRHLDPPRPRRVLAPPSPLPIRPRPPNAVRRGRHDPPREDLEALPRLYREAILGDFHPDGRAGPVLGDVQSRLGVDFGPVEGLARLVVHVHVAREGGEEARVVVPAYPAVLLGGGRTAADLALGHGVDVPREEGDRVVHDSAQLPGRLSEAVELAIRGLIRPDVTWKGGGIRLPLLVAPRPVGDWVEVVAALREVRLVPKLLLAATPTRVVEGSLVRQALLEIFGIQMRQAVGEREEPPLRVHEAGNAANGDEAEVVDCGRAERPLELRRQTVHTKQSWANNIPAKSNSTRLFGPPSSPPSSQGASSLHSSTLAVTLFRTMARTCNAAVTFETALLNPDVAFILAALLDARDLCRVSLTSKTLGDRADSYSGLSLVEEAARQLFECATEWERSCLPKYDGEGWIELYHHLLMLRSKLTFDQLVGGSVQYCADQSSFRASDRAFSALCSNHVMRFGRHFATFTVTVAAGSVIAGVIRPVQINTWSVGYGELNTFTPTDIRFWGYLRGKRTDRWTDSNVHCCSVTANGFFPGYFIWSDWTTLPSSMINGFQRDVPIGLLLDLDEGTLSLYQTGRRIAMLKDGLSGEYCWYSSGYDDTSISIERGLVPAD
ncbi:hypothetical protein THAOC_11747 [Thalassiosira oceanica]|uniref:Uncharacterized protein n=1 Tax=Thalassiosira oceanica TaxID=159749 RepID=K0SLU1_THAOC|nr:hypothetical protein THAOC_11747 [Thalassiosira oceanica]|eukprot:EJK67248.1 hypothetical protein THAOC_11747 [Thalassiosira oceanica]